MTVLFDHNGSLIDQKEIQQKQSWIVQYYIVLYYCNNITNV